VFEKTQITAIIYVWQENRTRTPAIANGSRVRGCS